MAYIPIHPEEYLEMRLSSNPSMKEDELRQRLYQALADFRRGIKCSCGNNIWVLGSAEVGNRCFFCITGKSNPTTEYEIDKALIKREYRQGHRHIDDMDPTKIAGIFDDDGYEILPMLIKKPFLCIGCSLNTNNDEEYLCDLNRYDQRNSKEFVCNSFQSI